MQVEKTMYTETAHRLCNYSGLCAHVHGHSWEWTVGVRASSEHLDKRGMLIDFADLKKAMADVLNPFDHALVLNQSDHLVQHRHLFSHVDPNTNEELDGRVIVIPNNPTSEILVLMLQRRIGQALMPFVDEWVDFEVRVSVKETCTSACSTPWERFMGTRSV